MKQKTAKKSIKTLAIVANVVIYVFCALCLLVLMFTIFSKRNADGAVQLFGYEMRVVLSGSMEKNSEVDVSDYQIKDIKTGSMVLVQLVPNHHANEWYSNLQVGDVLTIRYVVAARQETITHRIIDIQSKDTGGYIVTLRGDNVNGIGGEQIVDTDDVDSPNYVIGKVTGKSYFWGKVVYSLKRPQGLIMLVIIPSTVIIVWQVVKIVDVVKTGRRKSAEEAVTSYGEFSD